MAGDTRDGGSLGGQLGVLLLRVLGAERAGAGILDEVQRLDLAAADGGVSLLANIDKRGELIVRYSLAMRSLDVRLQ